MTNQDWSTALTSVVSVIAEREHSPFARRVRVVTRAKKLHRSSVADIWAHAGTRTIYVSRAIFSRPDLDIEKLALRILRVEHDLRDSRPTFATGIGRNVEGI